MKNEQVPIIANLIEKEVGIEAFCDWYSPGPNADEYWHEYEKLRGKSFKQLMNGYHVWNVFNFDKTHLDRCDAVMMVMPGGRSAHLELGYVIGTGKPGFILYDKEPERLDVMARFATDHFLSTDEMIHGLQQFKYREAVDGK